jgi:hypothetical protein
MRLSRTALLVLGIGIFVIALVAMYYINSGQTKEQAQLNESLAEDQALLPKLIAEREDLEGQVADWEKKAAEAQLALNKSEGKFPSSVESIDYNATLFRIADDCDLQIVGLTVSGPEDEKVKDTDITYAVTTFEVVVQNKESAPNVAGDFETYIDETVANVLDFINDIATSEEFTIATIEQVDMENLEPPTEEEVEKEAETRGDWPKATIQLKVYGFPR